MTKTYTKTFVSNLRLMVKHKGLNLGTTEVKAGVSRGYLSKLIDGHAKISLDTACTLAEIIGVGIQELLDEDLASVLKREKIQAEIRQKEKEIEELKRSIKI